MRTINKIEVLYNVTVENFNTKYFDTIENVVKKTLIYENISGNFEVSVSIVCNDEIQEINFEHRNLDKPTDVLSFPLITNFADLNKQFQHPLGDIIISYDKAIEQSNEYNHSLNREIAFLTAHSMLHLLGYDHMVKEEEEIMLSKQEEILKELNYTRVN